MLKQLLQPYTEATVTSIYFIAHGLIKISKVPNHPFWEWSSIQKVYTFVVYTEIKINLYL